MASFPTTSEQVPPCPACTACIELMLEYTAAGNQVVEIKRHFTADRSAALLNHACARKSETQKRLLEYQRQHPCCCQCPNRSSRP